jgi:hypothetical protein
MTRSCRRWFWALGALLVVVLAAVAVVVVRGRDAEPSLIRADAVPGMTLAYQNGQNGIPPGAMWCPDLGGGRYVRSPVTGSVFRGGGVRAGAMIVNPSPRGWDSAAIIAAIEYQAASCIRSVDPGQVRPNIEPLDGLPEGAVGWHLESQYEGWGEIAAIPLDADRVVLAGIESRGGADSPVDIRDLLTLALEGAEQLPADAG